MTGHVLAGFVLSIVMPALVAGIHVFGHCTKEDVDGRDKPGHDSEKYRLPQRHRRVALVTSPRGPKLGRTGDSG